MFKHLTNDFRYALRLLRKSPGFTVAVVLTLALGIGANTAMYSVLHAAFFAPYQLTRPDELMRLYTADRGAGGFTQLLFSVPKFRFARERQTVFSSLDAANYTGLTLLERGEPVVALRLG
jgi:putative ABC transport system permease protein